MDQHDTSISNRPAPDSTSKVLAYTPGPYIYCRGTDGCDETYDIYAEVSNAHIASIHFWECEQQSRANARLLASAPELVDALKLADRWLKQIEHSLYRGSELANRVQLLINRVTNNDADGDLYDPRTTAVASRRHP